jgi:hypothetical protein
MYMRVLLGRGPRCQCVCRADKPAIGTFRTKKLLGECQNKVVRLVYTANSQTFSPRRTFQIWETLSTASRLPDTLPSDKSPLMFSHRHTGYLRPGSPTQHFTHHHRTQPRHNPRSWCLFDIPGQCLGLVDTYIPKMTLWNTRLPQGIIQPALDSIPGPTIQKGEFCAGYTPGDAGMLSRPHSQGVIELLESNSDNWVGAQVTYKAL